MCIYITLYNYNNNNNNDNNNQHHQMAPAVSCLESWERLFGCCLGDDSHQ